MWEKVRWQAERERKGGYERPWLLFKATQHQNPFLCLGVLVSRARSPLWKSKICIISFSATLSAQIALRLSLYLVCTNEPSFDLGARGCKAAGLHRVHSGRMDALWSRGSNASPSYQCSRFGHRVVRSSEPSSGGTEDFSMAVLSSSWALGPPGSVLWYWTAARACHHLSFFFIFGGEGALHHKACRILVLQAGIQLMPLRWEHRVLTTEFQGSVSLSLVLIKACILNNYRFRGSCKKQYREHTGFLGQWIHSAWYHNVECMSLYICPNLNVQHQEP